MIDYPNKLDIIFDKLINKGAKPIIIGGFIRDNLLNIQSKDIDIEIYGISSFKKLEIILKEFGKVNSVGKSFGVCKLQYKNIQLDFTLPRTDSKIKKGHKGFEIKIEPNLDFKTAFSRRDFTINAIGFDIHKKELIDPFNGINDLNNKILRAVDENKFIDDPLRVLRAVQFCARFNLTIDKNLLTLSKNMIQKNMLNELSKDRIFGEIKKLLLKSEKPSIGFRLLKEMRALKYFTYLEDNVNFESILSVIDNMNKLLIDDEKTNIVLMLSSICYSFESSYLTNFIKQLSDEKEILNRVLPLVQNYNEINNIYIKGLNNSQLFNLATKVNIGELLLLSEAIYLSKNSTPYEIGTTVKQRAKELNILDKKLPAILQGRDILKVQKNLNIKCEPKEFSNILNNAYSAQINASFSSYEEALVWLQKYLKKLYLFS